MSAADLAEVLRARGLPVAAGLLAGAAAAPLFDDARVPPDPRLDAPPRDRLKAVLGQMARRGPDPRLVQAMWPWLATRPLERGLVAWDVLATCVLPPADPFAAELRAAARPLARVLPPPARVGVDLNAHPAAALIAAFAGAGAAAGSVAELVAAYDFSLATLERLRAAGDPMLRAPDVVDAIRAFAKLLQLAHLPTLAAVYFDFLARPLGHRPAALDGCETLFDAENAPAIPGDAVRRGDVPDAELSDLGEYLLYRSYLAVGAARDAHQLLEDNLRKRDRALGPPAPRLQLVRAHLGTLFRQRPIALDVVAQIADADPLWRYAARVRVVVAAAQLGPNSPEPLELFHDYLGGFGNDLRVTYEALSAAHESAQWRRDACAVLAREARALPHERGLWQAIFLTLGGSAEAQRATRELSARITEQSRLS